MSEENEAGFGKPPKHTQFKKGQSGNPKGRPKGSRNFSTDVKGALEEPVRLTKGGKRRTVSTQHAALMRLREKALRGDARALDRLIDLARTYNDEEIGEEAAKLSLSDSEVLEAYNERLMRKARKAQPNGSDEVPKDSEQGAEAANDNGDVPEEEDDDAWLN